MSCLVFAKFFCVYQWEVGGYSALSFSGVWSHWYRYESKGNQICVHDKTALESLGVRSWLGPGWGMAGWSLESIRSESHFEGTNEVDRWGTWNLVRYSETTACTGALLWRISCKSLWACKRPLKKKRQSGQKHENCFYERGRKGGGREGMRGGGREGKKEGGRVSLLLR